MNKYIISMFFLFVLVCAGCASRFWGGCDYIYTYKVDMVWQDNAAKADLVRIRISDLAKDMGMRSSKNLNNTYNKDETCPLPEELSRISGSSKWWSYSMYFDIGYRSFDLHALDSTIQLVICVQQNYCGYPTEYVKELDRRIRAILDETFGEGHYQIQAKRSYRPIDA